MWNNGNGYGFWNLKSFSGLISLDAHYRSGFVGFPGNYPDSLTSTFLSGELEIYTSSFFLHPNFFLLNANVGLRPVRNLDLYIISPDNSEINTAQKVELNGVLFEGRAFSINPYYNYNHIFSKREYTTNLETFFTNYGAGLYTPRLFLPSSINISQYNWEQKEIQTGRTFSTDQFTVNAEISKSFNGFSNNRFNVDYLDYQRVYSQNSFVHNKSFTWQLQNNFLIDRKNNFNLNSNISVINQTGSQTLNRFTVLENLYSNLPANIKMGIKYQYYQLTQFLYNTNQNNAEVWVEHKLFKSLTSKMFYNYVANKQNLYEERIDRMGIGFDYQKKIPTGILRLNYSYTFSKNDRKNDAGYINIFDEEIILFDGSTVVLNYPFVDIQSVVVKDITGTIIYQENFDYILIERENYTEIQRIIGGQISNGSIVLVTYTTVQQASLNFNSHYNVYGISITALNNFFEIYFRGVDQNFNNTDLIYSDYLKTLTQKLYGLRITYRFLDIGTEYETYISNIAPYNSLRYFLRISSNINNNFLATLTSNYRIYELLDYGTVQKFGDASIMLSYLVWSKSKILLEGKYVVQNGYQIDLNLTNINVEYLTSFRQINLSVGYQFYNRSLLGIHSQYSGLYAKVSRRF